MPEQIRCKLCNRDTLNELGGACRRCINEMFSNGGASIITVGKLLEYQTATLRRLEATEKLVPTRDELGSRRYSLQAVTDFIYTQDSRYFNKLLHRVETYDYSENEYLVEPEPVISEVLCAKCNEYEAVNRGYCPWCVDDFISRVIAAEVIGCSPVKLDRLISLFSDELTLYPFGTQVRLSKEEVILFTFAHPDTEKIKAKWSGHSLKCRSCKTTDRPHYGGGYCADCYKDSKEFTMMNGYMHGENLTELGDAMGISRERARQLFEKAIKIETEHVDPDKPQLSAYELKEQLKSIHKRNRAKRDYMELIENDYDHILEKLSEVGVIGEKGLLTALDLPYSVLPYIKQKYPEFIEIVNQNKKRWTAKFDECQMCGTSSIKHKRWGYCLNCYTKTQEWRDSQAKYRDSHIEEVRARNKVYSATYTKRPEVKEKMRQRTHDKNFDGNRELAFEVHGAYCSDCGISRDNFKRVNSKDLPVYRVDGNLENNAVANLRPICFSCLAKRTKGQLNAF